MCALDCAATSLLDHADLSFVRLSLLVLLASLSVSPAASQHSCALHDRFAQRKLQRAYIQCALQLARAALRRVADLDPLACSLVSARSLSIHSAPVRAGHSVAASSSSSDPLRQHLQKELAVSRTKEQACAIRCLTSFDSFSRSSLSPSLPVYPIRWYLQE